MTKFIGNNITLPKLATAPSSPVSGDTYYDTTNNKPYTYNGTSWVALTPSASGAMNYAQTQATKQTSISASGVTIVSASITTSGYPVQVMVTGDAENSAAGGWIILQLYRDSTAIGKKVHVESSAGSENVPYALTVIDAPSAGTYTYALKTASAAAAGTFNFGETDGPVLTVIELSGVTGATGATGATGPAVSLYSSTPEAIAATGSAGLAATAAKGDHVHKGVTSITGTAGQITASASDGPVTLSLTPIAGSTSSGVSGTSFVQSQNVDTYGRVSSVVSASVQDGTTSQKGIVQLNDTPTSGETTKAATSGSVFSVKTTADGALQTSSLGTGVATFLTTPSSANLAAAVTGETGSGDLVFATSPSLTTPTLGVASATSINKVAITAPATSATLTIANGKTLTANNTLTLTGTDSSSVDVGNGGSLSPAGAVTAWLGSNTSIPTGWLLCAGAAVSRSTYATLFAAIGTNFGTGDGSTTFNLPNLTGNFLVGANVVPGTSFQAGSTDAYLNASWTHAHSHSHATNPAATASGGPSATVSLSYQGGSTTASPGSSTHTHTTDIAATTSDTDATSSPTISVQRTRVNYIIKW